MNPKRTAEAIKNWCDSQDKTFMDLPFFDLWQILNVDRIKLVHITDNDDQRIPDKDLHDPATDADGFVPKTIGRSRSNYVRQVCFILQESALCFLTCCVDLPAS